MHVSTAIAAGTYRGTIELVNSPTELTKVVFKEELEAAQEAHNKKLSRKRSKNRK
jgi:hypothetical protein